MTSNELRNYIQKHSANEQGIINITEEFNFSEDIRISYTQAPIIFNEKIFSNYEVSFDGKVNITFTNGEFNKITINNFTKIELSNCKINEINNSKENTYGNAIKYGSLDLYECSEVDINLKNFYGKVRIENTGINNLKIGGNNFLDLEICVLEIKIYFRVDIEGKV
jgi:hypothetical protein